MVILHYLAKASSEGQVDMLMDKSRNWPVEKRYVDFPYSPRWVRPGYVHAPDYMDNWIEYNVCSFAHVVSEDWAGTTPERYKGLVVTLDEGCDPIWLAFGKYDDQHWVSQHFTRTFGASKSYETHIQAVGILRAIEPLLDELWVLDHAHLWESDDMHEGHQAFQDGMHKLKALSEALGKTELGYGHTAHAFDPSVHAINRNAHPP